VYSEDRKAVHPASHLQNFSGVIQVDGYQGFGAVLRGENGDSRELAFCFAHARRKFYELYASDKSPIAGEALQRIAALYQIEAEIRGTSEAHRRSVRQQRSRPLLEAMHEWLAQQLGRLSGSSDLAKAIRYSLSHWKGLTRFLDDGRLDMDTNTVERAIKPIVMTRKNALFAGSDSGGRHWSIVASLIQTAKLNDIDPLAWLTDVLTQIVTGQTKQNNLASLLPWNWKDAKTAEASDTS
jgi:hypothetical protein